jgi:hypothetical protein
VARPQKPADKVFLNIPYDEKFKRLFLAFIAGISAFGMVPRATLEIPTSRRRLERILGLIGDCQFSIHDLCRMEIDRKAPQTPRFNMPFELGLRWLTRKRSDKSMSGSCVSPSGTDSRNRSAI